MKHKYAPPPTPTMHQSVVLLTVLVVVQLTLTLAQLPLRIDVTWFEKQDEWQADSAVRADANFGVNKNDGEAASEPEQEETDRHTQQAWA